MEVILYSKECNWYTRCCPLNGGVRYRECPLREATLYMYQPILPSTYFTERSQCCPGYVIQWYFSIRTDY